MKVLVTGGTGFTGAQVIPKLLQAGAEVTCFVRPKSNTLRLPRSDIKLVQGDFDERGTLAASLRGIDAFVNVASLGFGHGPLIVGEVQQAGVERAVFISTTAVFTSLNAPSKAIRLAAEKCIQESSLAYTILRPTMIYGSSRDRNMCRLIRYLWRWPVIPVFGGGEHLQQPVFVEDLATAIVRVLFEPRTLHRCYNISGANALTYNEVIDTICRLLRRHVRRWHLSAEPIVKLLRLCERFPLKLPVKAEQVQRLNENKAFDHADALRDFRFRPRSFAEGITVELVEMGLFPIAPQSSTFQPC